MAHRKNEDSGVGIEEQRRHRLRLSLLADRCPNLLPLLEAAYGAAVGGTYRIEGLLAVGRQFFVWLAAEAASGREVVLKQARFDYRYPARYGRADAEQFRRAIRKEYDVLLADRGGTLPRPLALLVTDSPVPAASRSPALARDEAVVAEEYVCGLTLAELALRVWPDRPPEECEATVARVASAFVTFWEQLWANGWHYADISADNLLVGEPAGALRVVDGGSAVPAGEEVVVPGFTPAFTTPRLFEAMMTGRPVPGTLASVLPQLGKVIHFALTRREPWNGQPPPLSEPALSAYSRPCLRTLEAFARLDEFPESLPDARAALSEWLDRVR
jgi:hypothetical protein